MVGQVQVFIFDGPPSSFDKDGIKDPPPAIPTDLHASGYEPIRESRPGELTVLITVDNLGTAVRQGLFQRRETEGGVLGV